MAVKFQHRRDSAANWASVDPVLAEGERGWDTTNRRWKTGDGATAWSGLSYDEKAFTPRGSYNNGTAYLQDDLVLDQGSSWVALQSTTGNAPPTLPATSNAYWQLVALSSVGADGFVVGKQLNFSNATTDVDPGAGEWRRNNAAFASVTELYIDNEDNGANSITAWLDSLDDGATTNDRGRLTAVQADDPDVWEEYKVTGTVTDGTGYRKVTVTPIGTGAAFADGVETVFVFHATGEAGADGAGAVDSVNGKTGVVVLDPDDLDDSATTNKFASAGQLALIDTVETNADVTDATNVGSAIHGSASKPTPVDADAVPLIDSAAANVLKKLTWANIKTALSSVLLPLAGGTLTGALNGQNITSLAGQLVSRASGAGNAHYWLYDNTGAAKGVVYWNASSGDMLLRVYGSGGNYDLTLKEDGTLEWRGNRIVDVANISSYAATKGALEGLNTQTGTTYTLVIADAGKAVEMNNASANTLTVPPNSSVAFPVGTQILVRQLGAGQTTIAAGSGVTIRSKDDNLKLDGQYVEATLTKRATDEWVLTGALAA